MPKGNIINGECILKHGMAKTRFYDIYHGVLKRCANPNSLAYKDYGGRGILVCNEWKEDFLKFKKDMYESYLVHVAEHGEKNTTIERKDVNGNYEPSNCIWTTREVQNNNSRRVRKYEFQNKQLTLPQICKITGADYKTTYLRINRGWSLEKALNTPNDGPGKYKRNEKHRELARRAMNEIRANQHGDEV